MKWTNSWKNVLCICYVYETNSELWKKKEPKIAKKFLRNTTKAKGFSQTEIKTYWKCNWSRKKQRPAEQNYSPETELLPYENFICDGTGTTCVHT